MNQFTSHIDFKLTRKRLELMNKNRSWARRIIRLLPLLPMFLFITFLFCDRQTNSDELYSDVELQHISLPFEQVRDSGFYYDSRMYDMNEKLFTGTQSYYFKSDNKIFTSVTFKEGLRVKEQTFRRTGEEWYRVEIGYDFETGKRISLRAYEHGVLIRDGFNSSPENNGLDRYREWHPNGQLKFEMTSYSTDDSPAVYEGLMTRYDQNGTILEQELYKDGELIEKIK